MANKPTNGLNIIGADAIHTKNVEALRRISDGARQSLATSLCPNEQAEYDRRLASAGTSEPPPSSE